MTSSPLFLTQALVPYETAAKWQGGRGFADSYAWHQRVWDAFPGRPEAERDFLTRIDPLDEAFRLLILSRSLPERPPWCPEPGWRTKQIPEDFLSRKRYRFSLVANPTRKVKSNARGELLKNSRRVPILHREDREGEDGGIRPGLISWLIRQGERHGFRLPEPDNVKTVPGPRRWFVKKGVSGLHAAIEFQGVLEVTDSEAFARAFASGVGPARAFGFGMLCLVPLS